MSQWVGDVAIDTKQSCDQQLWSFTQDPGKPESFIQDPHGRKTPQNIESSHTSQDNIRDFVVRYASFMTVWCHRSM